MTPSELKLGLLGPMECRITSGARVQLPTRKAEVLLAYLALNPGALFPRYQLTDLLWSDRGADQAKNSLRQSLSAIKKVFGSAATDVLKVDRKTVGLNSKSVRVDLCEFEQLVDNPTMDGLQKAVKLCRGEFLQGVEIRDPVCQEWLDNERRRVGQSLTNALYLLCQMQLDDSQFDAAIESAERLLMHDPLREAGWRALMIAQQLSGNRNNALRAYQRCRNILDTELGIEPDVETREMHEQIKRGEFTAPDKFTPDSANSRDTATSICTAPKTYENPHSHEHLMQGWYHAEKHNPTDTAIAIEQFKKCIEIDPEYADAHAILAAEYHVELFENWSKNRSKSLGLARLHLDKALLYEPDNACAHAFMAEHMLFQRDFARASFHADRAVAIDPKFPDSHSMRAIVSAAMREYDDALKSINVCLQLDPHHPYSGWNGGVVYRAVGDYERAIRTFRRVPNMPPSLHAEIAACLAGLGRYTQARDEMARYQKLARRQMPSYPSTHDEWYSLWYRNASHQFDEDFEKTFDLFVKASLCENSSDKNQAVQNHVIPSIAVLPFENMSGDPDREYFTDGVTNDIIATLSGFKSMRVVARQSTLQYKHQKLPLSAIADEQGVRYILAGNIRQSGNKIRVNAELIDSTTSEIVWVEQYDRHLDDVFLVQDDISKNIAAAMKVRFQSGKREYQRADGTENKKAWELCLIAADLQDSYIRENVLEARRAIKKALTLDSEYCDAWVSLGWTYWQEIYCGWEESIEIALGNAEDAVQNALALDSTHAEAWSLSGNIHLMRHALEAGINDCKKAVELQPGNAEVHALLACAQCFTGDYEDAKSSYDTSVRLSPVCPNWYVMIGGIADMGLGRIRSAIDKLQKAVDIEPNSPLCRFYLVDALIEAGECEAAEMAAEEIEALDDSFRFRGIVRTFSHDRVERDRLRDNLAQVGLRE